jgi:Ca2+-binding EF-hand superfamily protein
LRKQAKAQRRNTPLRGMAREMSLSARSAWCRPAKIQEHKMGSSISGMGFGGMPSASQMSQMREKMFSKADANSDGSVDKAEFAKAGPQGADSKKADEMFAKIDSDGNGKISKDESSAFDKKMSSEMQSMMLSMQNSGSAGGMPDLSQLFGDTKSDKTSSVNGSNSTQSKQDARNRLEELFTKADGDKDGKLSKDELNSAAEQMQAQFKSSLLSAQEQAQKSGGSGNDTALFSQLFNNSSSNGSSSGSSDPFTSLMMKQLQAV